MVEPRKPRDVKRIIKQANYASAEADLEEFDALLSAEASANPSIERSADERKKDAARQRRLRFLSRRLFKSSR